MLKFIRKTDGLVTIEWVGIAAVLVLAAVGVTSFVMQGTDAAGGTVSAGIRSVDASNPGMGQFGNGTADAVN
jgi:hypothetical protein